MSTLRRGGDASLTGQIAELLQEAIASGELAPGDKLPPTRELAELTGVNHLTAVRAYRRLRDHGLVSAHVGRGTFVREPAPALLDGSIGSPAEGTEWQRYALPESGETFGDRVLAEMYAQSQARGLIPLSVGYPATALSPVDAIRGATERALAKSGPAALQYTDIAGLPELREQLALLSSRRGLAEDSDDLIVTSGAKQGLTLSARALLRPGDVVACESPTFVGVLQSLRSTRARVLPVPVDEGGLDLDALESLLRRHEVRLLALQPRAHNPTGRDLAPARRTRLVELARRHGFFILEDAIYADLRYEGDPGLPLRAEAPEHVIYVDSLSKTVGGGLRAGWVAASGPVRERILAEKQRDDMHSATLPQLAVAHFLAASEYEPHLEWAIAFHRERRDALIAAMREHLTGFATFDEPAAGGHVWAELDPSIDERELTAAAVRHGVTVVPGEATTPEPAPGRGGFRASFAFLDPEELAEGARRLGRAARSLTRQPRDARALPVA